jgi:hypothetical protein
MKPTTLATIIIIMGILALVALVVYPTVVALVQDFSSLGAYASCIPPFGRCG